uniref:Uncharacterized protein n=1 Tax=Cajanus cajan TaxID=3821 RepID=A0A151RTZ5_CAJCA|nr:hypothetical protein KK1_032399 [Cajanus cajan]
MTEPIFFYYYNIIRYNNLEVAQWLDNIPREKWMLAWDNGRCWGHMTTNIIESINLILKKIRNLPICSMIMATYTCCMITFNIISTRFLVEETQHPGEVQPLGRFTIRLDDVVLL